MPQHRQPASTWVLLADVRMSERRRQGLSAQKVELYRQWLEDGRHAPPVGLARDGGGFVVRDGRHRVAAALAAGHVGIEAVLRRLLGMKLWWRAPRLQRGGAGSNPAVSITWGRSMRSAIAPAGVPGSCSRKTPNEQREDEGSNPSGSIPPAASSDL